MTQLKVGVFIVSGLAVLLTTIFMIGSNKSLFQETFMLHSYFDSVVGLNKGAVVSLAGVKVGNLEDVSFDETKNLVKVDFQVDREFLKKIKKDSRIEIRTQGALGDKYLYITPGVDAETVSSGGEIKSDYGNDILSVLSKRGSESEKLFDVLDDLKKITGSLADGNRLPKITQNLEAVTANLARITGDVNTTSLNRSIVKIEKIVDKVDRGEGTLGALINDKSVHERIKNMIGAGQKSQQVKNILKSSVEE
jgi:phospholipid/cholesterol/gamma-HCH transport system substrate-binding protein